MLLFIMFIMFGKLKTKPADLERQNSGRLVYCNYPADVRESVIGHALSCDIFRAPVPTSRGEHVQ